MNVAIIGCGRMGHKRAHALAGCRLTICVDSLQDRAENLAKQFPGCIAMTDWRAAIHHPDVQIVIVSTVHAFLAEIGLAAVRAGKHLLLEKPAARETKELLALKKEMVHSPSFVRVGFNHRYHRGLRKARELVDEGALGELMLIRGRYGHGGRLGYEKEWRAQPELSGGGELLDQGIHLIDLARWFLGDFSEISGHAGTYFWDMPVDDNGFLLLKTAKKQVAFLHASCTEWKNLFSFEIFGRQGKIEIQGLGGSYGTERVIFHKMSPALGPPETLMWEYLTEDDSWAMEFSEFLQDIRQHRQPAASIDDAYAALQIVEAIYRKGANG